MALTSKVTLMCDLLEERWNGNISEDQVFVVYAKAIM